MTPEEIKSEMEKCKDLEYFTKNYTDYPDWSESEKRFFDAMLEIDKQGLEIAPFRGRGGKLMFIHKLKEQQ